MKADQPVSSLMKRSTVTVVPDTTLRDLAEILWREEIGAVVVRGDEGPAGIASERDLVGAVVDDCDLDADRVSDVMTYEVATLAPDDPISAAAQIMVDGGIRHLPAVEGAKVVGMVSMRDVLAALHAG